MGVKGASVKAKAEAAKTTSALPRTGKLANTAKKSARNALQKHIVARAGRWEGYCSGEDLLRRTRP